MLIEFLRGVGQIGFGDDVVAVEHGPGLVTGDSHRDDFGNSGSDEIPDAGPAKIVEELRRFATGVHQSRPHTRADPGCLEGTDRLTFARENPLAVWVECIAGFLLLLEGQKHVGDERDDARLIVLSRAGFEADDSVIEIHLRPLEAQYFAARRHSSPRK